MDLTVAIRLLLLYAHLLLCVFALHCVITTDGRLLRSQMNAAQLLASHHRVVWLLAGLWISGLVIAGIDTELSFGNFVQRPKLVAKWVCVSLLTLNGVLLRAWCFPRLAGRQRLGQVEAVALMVCGALSTTSWLMAAFFGIARPLQTWTILQCLAVYWAALAVAVPVALAFKGRLLRGLQLAADGAPDRAAAPGGIDNESLRPAAM